MSGKPPGGSLRVSELVYLKIKEADSFLIRLSSAFILHRSFGFLCLESWVNNYKVNTHCMPLEGWHLYWKTDCLFAGKLSESLHLIQALSPNAPGPPFACLFCVVDPPLQPSECSVAALHISEGKERSVEINGHIDLNSHMAGICLNMCLTFGLSSIKATFHCTPTYMPRALLGALKLALRKILWSRYCYFHLTNE